MISAVLVVGLAAYFVYFAVGHAPFLRWAFNLLARVHPTLPRCPWCLSGWVAAPLTVLLVLTGTLTWLEAIVVWPAAACVAGLAGSLLPDEGGVDA